MRALDYDKIIKEHFDCNDDETRGILISVEESEQNAIISNLTSKLYDNIVKKVDDIDYGTIPQSAGDITQIQNYDQMVECVAVIREYLEQYNQDTEPVQVIEVAIKNMIERKEEFERGFKLQIEFVMVMYCNIIMAIVSSISLMIQSAIEFIKEPNKDTFAVSIDKVSLQKTKQSLVFNNLRKFNKTCASKDFDKVLEYIVSNSTKHFIGSGMGVVATGGALAILALSIIPLIRELIFFFYHSRTTVSDYFEIQADLLQMNAYNIQNNNSMNQKDKKEISSKQMKIVSTFRKISNFLAIDSKQAEIKAVKDVSSTQKKYKADEILDEKPDTASTSNSLF